MTVYSTETFTDWVATNGVKKTFNYDFTVFIITDMYLLVRSEVNGEEVRVDAGFTMTPGDKFSGGVVTYPSSGAAISAGSSIRIVREVDYTQTQKIGNEGAFRPEIHERAFDRLTQQTQQLASNFNRSIKVPLGENGIEIEKGLEGQVPIFDEDGNLVPGFVNSITRGDIISYKYVGDGATTDWSINSNEGPLNNILISVGGSFQLTQETSFVKGTPNKIRLSPAVPAGVKIELRILVGTVEINTPASGSVGFSQLTDEVIEAINDSTDKDVMSLKSASAINVTRDKASYGMVANFIRTLGDSTYNELYGTQREIQYFAQDVVNGYWYTIHDNDLVDNRVIMIRYPKAAAGSINVTQDQVSLPTSLIGHQGLAVENLSSGEVKFWSTDGTNKLNAMRFDFVNGAEPLNIQKFTLFSEAQGFNPNVSCFDGIGFNQDFVVAHGLLVGQQRVICRIWDKAKMLASGAQDQTTTFLTEFDVKDLYAPSTHPVQGLAFDGETILGVSGGNGFAVAPRRAYRFAFPGGEILDADHNFMVGSVEASADGTGISYEPEGLQVISYNGLPRFSVGIRSGSSLNPSVFRVYALGVSGLKEININASGPIEVARRLGIPIGGTELNTTAIKHMAYGIGVNYRMGTNGVDDWEIEQTLRGLRPMTTDTQKIGQSTRRVLEIWTKILVLASNVIITSGPGSPEGALVAAVGSEYTQTDGAGGLVKWYKNTGTGNTGWGLRNNFLSAIQRNGVQVVNTRVTGWAADTGTAKRTANATYTGTAEAAYTQATVQTLMNEVRDLSQVIKALKDDLIAHGLIGA